MSDTPGLLERISAFRQRLEQIQHLDGPVPPEDNKIVVAGPTLRVTSRMLSDGEISLPSHLTAHARRLVERGRDLIVQLRNFGEEPLLGGPPPIVPEVDPSRLDPLVQCYRETVAMTEASLRLVQCFPDTPSVQLRLCEGLEAILEQVEQRLQSLHEVVTRRNEEINRIDTLAGLLNAINDGKDLTLDPFLRLSQLVWQEATIEPLRFPTASPNDTQACPKARTYAPPARFIAAHSLATAQVVARLIREDPTWEADPRTPILAALLHDVGMLRVPVDILAQSRTLTAEQRRSIEAHPRASAEMVLNQLPNTGRVIEAVAQHHERLGGNGYPDGLKGDQIATLARLLAVADIYAALVSPRPYRPALDPRSALTDTLMLAEKGHLDPRMAEKLLVLSFYPNGSVVELADGSLAVVVANHLGYHRHAGPARPVLGILTDPSGTLLATPRYVDLAASETGNIVRSVPDEQRRALLGRRYPNLAQ